MGHLKGHIDSKPRELKDNSFVELGQVHYSIFLNAKQIGGSKSTKSFRENKLGSQNVNNREKKMKVIFSTCYLFLYQF